MNIRIILEKKHKDMLSETHVLFYVVRLGFCPPKELEQISLTVDSIALRNWTNTKLPPVSRQDQSMTDSMGPGFVDS